MALTLYDIIFLIAKLNIPFFATTVFVSSLSMWYALKTQV